ncbi:MAG: FHA domain-containing protein [Nocardioides sp.]
MTDKGADSAREPKKSRARESGAKEATTARRVAKDKVAADKGPTTGTPIEQTSVLAVAYTGELDEVTEFTLDGQSRLFGRDDQVCDIVIWGAINDSVLSRIAGRIWRMEGELWLRNLSTTHELWLIPDVGPPEPPLPPRADDGRDPGAARSIPRGTVFVRGPGGCELVVHQRPSADFTTPLTSLDDTTVRVGGVPDKLRAVAAALCEPLLAGGQLPASYAEIGRRLDFDSLKKTRLLVGELVDMYADELPQLRQTLDERREQREAAEAIGAPRLQAGIWTFDDTDTEPDEDDLTRRRSLNLPDYYEVAHLLVRRRLITVEDLGVLKEQAG